MLDIADKKVSLVNAFGMLNEVINQFVRAIADIISRPGHINVDFADVSAIMKNTGMAVMGTGRASGPNRAEEAARQAISSPLLGNMTIEGARGVLFNITGSSNLGLDEVSAASSIIEHDADRDANIIFGFVVDESLGDDVMVTVIATGVVPKDAHMLPYVQVTPTVRDSTNALRPLSPTAERNQGAANSSFQLLESLDQKTLEVPTILRRMVKEKETRQKTSA